MPSQNLVALPLNPDVHWDVVLWSRDFETGHAGIDSDHKKLIILFNELAQSVNRGSGAQSARELLDELLEYTRYHFSREEHLMQEFNCPDYARHKDMHETFSRQVDDISRHYAGGDEIGAFLLSFLGKWLTGHILTADRQLGRFLAETGGASRVAPPQEFQ